MTTIDSKALEAVADILWRNIHGDVKWLDYEERHYIKVAEAAITAYLSAIPSPKVEGEIRHWYCSNCGELSEVPVDTMSSLSPVLADEGVAGAAAFLLDRLDDLERGWDTEEAFNDFASHVIPAMARLRAALASTNGGDK